MLLFASADEGGTHRAGKRLSARADSVAHLNRSTEAILTGEIVVGINFNGVVFSPESEVFCHRRRIDDFAGVHDTPRVEGVFHLAECLVNLRAEHTLKPLASDEPIAVFAAHRAIKFHEQVAYFARDAVHLQNVRLGLQVHNRPVVQQSDAGVRVIGGRRPVRGDNLVKAADIFGEVFNRHGGILHEAHRLCIPLHAHQQAESSLSSLPNARFLFCRETPHECVTESRAFQRLLKPI